MIMKKDCCNDERNLVLQLRERSDLEVHVCQVCGCRHFGLIADPGKIFAIGTQIGGAPKQQ